MHNNQSDLEKRVEALEIAMKNIATRAEISDIVREAMVDVLLTAGKGTKAVIITAATVIGSIIVIGGGLKWFLGYIGFTYLR